MGMPTKEFMFDWGLSKEEIDYLLWELSKDPVDFTGVTSIEQVSDAITAELRKIIDG